MEKTIASYERETCCKKESKDKPQSWVHRHVEWVLEQCKAPNAEYADLRGDVPLAVAAFMPEYAEGGDHRA